MDKGKGLDVLILTALHEEYWVLVRALKGGPPESGDSTTQDIRGMKVGMVSLSQMGNVLTQAIAAKLVWETDPRCVILTGIAGSVNRKTLRLGDAVFARECQYHSFGKTIPSPKSSTESAFQRERLETLSTALVGKTGKGIRNLIKHGFGTSWVQQAKQLFLDCRDDAIWEELPEQVGFRSPPRTRFEDYTSGETVVKSPAYSADLKKEHGTRHTQAIDMETFGLCALCAEFGIPFIAVKGITDYCNTRKNDRHRVRALCSACSALRALVESADFENLVKDSPGTPTPEWWEVKRCLSPLASSKCEYGHPPASDGTRDWPAKECVDLCLQDRWTPDGVSWLTRVFENIHPSNYSHKLEEYLPSAIKRETQVLTIFPYSPKEIIRLCINDGNKKRLRDAALPLAEYIGRPLRRWRRDRSELEGQLDSLARMWSSYFPHFLALDKYCKEQRTSGTPEGELAKRVARVLVLRTEDILLFESSPAWLLYSRLLGQYTPTFIVGMDHTEYVDLPAEDITYIVSGREVEDDSLRALPFSWVRYLTSTRTMIVSGLPCLKSRNDANVSVGIVNLHSEWEEQRAKAVAGESATFARVDWDTLPKLW